MTAARETSDSEARSVPRIPLSQHVIRSLRLAVPVMFGRAGLVIMISVDSMMVGRSGAQELAHYAISLAPHITLLVVGIGLLVGTIILTAQADGAGRTSNAGAIWLSGLFIAGAMGLISGTAMMWGEDVLLLFGQSASVASGGGASLAMFAPGMPAILMFIATTFFLEGLGRPAPGMIVALSANLLNALLNWVLIFGHLGAPEMGAAGASLATTLTRWAMLAFLIGYVLTMPDRGLYGIALRAWGHYSTALKLLRIGAPLSVAAALESACFSTVTIFAGRLGELPLAAYQIAFNVVMLVFMLSIGLSTATSVRVANAVGRRDRHGAALAGWTGIGMVSVLMVGIALAIAISGPGIASLYTSDAAVLTLAIPALLVASAIVLVDGTQAVVLGALRGTGDVVLPSLIYALSFWVVSVPLAYAVLRSESASIVGLFWALFAGLLCAGVLLAWRFQIVTRHTVHVA